MTAPSRMPTRVRTWSKMKLWSYGHERLGYGNWDETISYTRFKIREAGFLSSVMTKRGITPEEWVLAVDYCHKHRKSIERPVDVLIYIREAKDWKAGFDSEQHASDLAADIADAIARERSSAQPDDLWIARLARARGSYRAEVLDEWRRAKRSEGVRHGLG